MFALSENAGLPTGTAAADLLLDTPREEEFERLTRMAARLFDVPTVLVSLLDESGRGFKTQLGYDACGVRRDFSFCTHTLNADEVLVVPDARRDTRFAGTPLVRDHPFIRFYAGTALITADGTRIGTVFLLDSAPRDRFPDADRRTLTDLAAMVVERLELRRRDQIGRFSQTRFEKIAATSPDAIICATANGGITFCNEAANTLFGYEGSELIGRATELLVPEHWRQHYLAELGRLRHGETPQWLGRAVELTGRRKDGTQFPAEFSFSAWHEDQQIGLGAIVRDLTERQRNEERLFQLATRDTLTELPNRGAWTDCLAKTLSAGTPAAVLLFDLDGFKAVNDTLGHSAGDAVLQQIAGRLNAVFADAIMVARIGGDEFVALLEGDDEQKARELATQLIATVRDQYEADERRVEVGVSVGIALAPRDGKRAEALLGAADLALYRAKNGGKNRYEVFTPALREGAAVRRVFEQELRHAFETGQFELYYQPQVSTNDRKVRGAEALLRWNHPERGVLTPAAFLYILNRKPSAADVGKWILRTACKQAAEWRRHAPDFRIGVNLFAAQCRAGVLLPQVREALDESGLPPEALELEIVENIMVQNDASTLQMMHDLRDMGVGLAFDDYGTGFASLSLLKYYPVSRLKIDRAFVYDLQNDPNDVAIVRAMLYLARNFGTQITAEGVETEEQFEFLRDSGCPDVQGYLFGRPVPGPEFARTNLGITTD
ncbi:PAS domain S-box-containing protein/diguanylate cyclase (GGDEF) domain-containing protein [Tranquillimonas rosea]|uniref:PAS domain S-box-containing protein/diguanylate cyclase (GGDEF) domain-containing protein n=1 Tax=Tranquillimonas rosea TaxID=641238 RepID=A0A1H9SND8_9RHOB|nr:EAL domain-containing protein [Tranquillimonas rosea]SER86255.1 PAS domain S-box-containing protein/diguanylate cyclase (GGDEF) domain-containing protein [Tranquillimonas rosea]